MLTIYNKLIGLLFLFLLSNGTAFAQQKFLKGRVLLENSSPVSQANISLNGKETEITSNYDGSFIIKVQAFDTINVVYRNANEFFIVPQTNQDTLEHIFVLKIKSQLVEEVEVTSSRLVKVAGEKNEHIIDYYVFENNEVVLLSKRSNDYFLSFKTIDGTDSEYKLGIKPKSFFPDCYGNLHIRDSRFTYQLWIDSTLKYIDTVQNKIFDEHVAPHLLCNEVNLFEEKYLEYNQRYILSGRTNDTVQIYVDVIDTIKWKALDSQAFELYKMCVTCRKNWPEWKIFSHADYKLSDPAIRKELVYVGHAPPDYEIVWFMGFIRKQMQSMVPLSSHNLSNNIVTVDFFNDSIYVFNDTGKRVYSTPIQCSDPSKQDVLKDPYRKKIFLRNNEFEPILEIANLNLQNGDIVDLTALNEVRFPEKVKIFNNRLYFMAANEAGFSKLYFIYLPDLDSMN